MSIHSVGVLVRLLAGSFDFFSVGFVSSKKANVPANALATLRFLLLLKLFQVVPLVIFFVCPG